MKTFKVSFQIHEGLNLINQSIALIVAHNRTDILNILLKKLNQANGYNIAFFKKEEITIIESIEIEEDVCFLKEDFYE